MKVKYLLLVTSLCLIAACGSKKMMHSQNGYEAVPTVIEFVKEV